MIKSYIISALNFYQRISRHLFGFKVCRFYPSCSEYAKQAILKYGVIRGGLKGIWRISRCHPFNNHYGYDPID